MLLSKGGTPHTWLSGITPLQPDIQPKIALQKKAVRAGRCGELVDWWIRGCKGERQVHSYPGGGGSLRPVLPPM